MEHTVPIDAEILANLEAERDRVLLGERASSVMVTPNGHKTDFVAPDLKRLDARIEDVKAKVEGRPRRGAIGFTF